jgi:hypothetical protein
MKCDSCKKDDQTRRVKCEKCDLPLHAVSEEKPPKFYRAEREFPDEPEGEDNLPVQTCDFCSSGSVPVVVIDGSGETDVPALVWICEKCVDAIKRVFTEAK